MPSKKNSRWPRFSLRSLFCAVTLIALGLGWHAYEQAYVDRELPRLMQRDIQLRVALSEERFADAYEFMSPDYRRHMSIGEFEKRHLTILRADPKSYQRESRPDLVKVYRWRASLVCEHYSDEWPFEYGLGEKWILIDGQWYDTGDSWRSLD